jgi:hypothetical protein
VDMRYERIRYFRKVSNKTKRGLRYHEPWHEHGCYRQPREDRYKNVDRTTIRKATACPRPFGSDPMDLNSGRRADSRPLG